MSINAEKDREAAILEAARDLVAEVLDAEQAATGFLCPEGTACAPLWKLAIRCAKAEHEKKSVT